MEKAVHYLLVFMGCALGVGLFQLIWLPINGYHPDAMSFNIAAFSLLFTLFSTCLPKQPLYYFINGYFTCAAFAAMVLWLLGTARLTSALASDGPTEVSAAFVCFATLPACGAFLAARLNPFSRV